MAHVHKLDRALCLRLLETEKTAAGVHRALAAQGINVIVGTVRRILKGQKDQPGRKTKSRFAATFDPGRIVRLPAINNPALAESRTLYPHTVIQERINLLKSGTNSSKIGGVVLKGKWRGMPIYTLTLEERATCPVSCGHWRSCVVVGTPVLGADLHWRPIESLAIGDKIVGFDEEPEVGRRKSRISTVEAIRRSRAPCFLVKTTKGDITATADHRFLSRKVLKSKPSDPEFKYLWRHVGELKEGDSIQFLSEPWEFDRSYESGRVRGFVEGEGCLSTWGNGDASRSEISWAQLPGKLIEEINAIVRGKGFTVVDRVTVSGVNDSTVTHSAIAGGWRETLKFIGTFRPTRLIEKIEALICNRVMDGRGSDPAKVISVEAVGECEIVEISTSSKTLITNGFLSHNCYGNSMNFALRIDHTAPGFGTLLAANVKRLGVLHPDGFVVRLHVLGDFYSAAYVSLWDGLLDAVPALRVFGYSARWDARSDPVAAALVPLVMRRWERFAIRFSDAPIDECSTVSIEHPMQLPADAVLCPEQAGKTESCSSCGFCWHSKRRVGFVQH